MSVNFVIVNKKCFFFRNKLGRHREIDGLKFYRDFSESLISRERNYKVHKDKYSDRNRVREKYD